MGESDGSKIIEQTIALFNGRADELKEDNMPRPKGSKNKGTATAEVTAPVQPTSVSVPDEATKTAMITEWKNASDQLTELKAKEHTLRQALVAHLFDGTKLEGSDSIDIGWGYQLRLTRELAYNASNKDGETDKLVEALKARDPNLADSLIRWQPDVAKKVYKQVHALAEQHQDAEFLKLLHEAITLKPGMPKLEFVPPKQDVLPVQEPIRLIPDPVQAPTYVMEDSFSAE